MNNAMQRGNRRAFDPKSFTRAQATRVIANTSDTDLIQKFSEHNNKHVRRYVFHKLGGVAEIRAIFSSLGALFSLCTAETPKLGDLVSLDSNLSVEITLLVGAMATEYGESFEMVRDLLQAKGGDAAALKRSLISRKSARTRAAKKNGG